MNVWPVFAGLVVVIVGMLAIRHASRRRALLATMQRNTERQGVIIAILDRIEVIMKDATLSPAEARVATGLLIAELRAMDDDGILVPLIDDTEGYIDERLAKRAG